MFYVFAQVLDFFDAAITASLDAGISGMVSAVRTPMWLALVLWLIFRGWQASSGNTSSLASDLLRESLGLILVVCLCTNADLFNRYVRDFFFFGVPSYFAEAAATITAPVGGTGGPAQGGTIGEQLTVLWAQVWRACGEAWRSGWSVSGFIIDAAVVVTLGVAAVGLIACAVVYIIGHFFLAIVIVLGPVFIAFVLFAATRQFFDRWGGKVASLILLQVVAIVVTAFVCRANLMFLDGAKGAAGNADAVKALQALFGVAVVFGIGAAAMWFVPQFAYSLGTGLMVNPLPSPRMPRLPGGGDKQPGQIPLNLQPQPNFGVSLAPPAGLSAPPAYRALPPAAPTPLGPPMRALPPPA